MNYYSNLDLLEILKSFYDQTMSTDKVLDDVVKDNSMRAHVLIKMATDEPLRFYDSVYNALHKLSKLAGTPQEVLDDKYINDFSMGGVILIQEKCSMQWLTNLTLFEFNKMYASILVNELKRNEHNYSPSHFPEIFILAYDLLNFIKDSEDLMSAFGDNIYKIIRTFVNMTFGVLRSEKTKYGHATVDLARFITSRASMMMNKIKNEFSGHWVYIDTDMVVFKHYDEISVRLEKMLDGSTFCGCPYSVEHGKSGMFIGIKKYILGDAEPNPDKMSASVGNLRNVKVRGIARK